MEHILNQIMVGHEISLNKFKKIVIILSIFSYHCSMKLEINYKITIKKHTDTWRLNYMLLENEWVKNQIKEETKRCLETNENENIMPKYMEKSERSPKKEIHNTEGVS